MSSYQIKQALAKQEEEQQARRNTIRWLYKHIAALNRMLEERQKMLAEAGPNKVHFVKGEMGALRCAIALTLEERKKLMAEAARFP